MRRDGRPAIAAIRIADRGHRGRTRGVGIGRYAESLAQVHRRGGGLHLVVLRRHGVVERGLGLRRQSNRRSLAGIAGRVTLASIWTGFGSGFGFGISICLGCNSTFGISGGGGCTLAEAEAGLMCSGGGGVAGTISSVIS